MANLRSFTGFLALDVLNTQNVAAGLSFVFPGTNPLDIIIQDGDALLQGDSVTNDQSADPEGDQIGFVTNSDGEALLDGQEIFVETSFTFTLDGAGSFTGYVLENEGSGQSFIVLPPNLAAGTIAITATDDTATDIDYALLGSGDEDINQNDFSDLDLSGADTINAGGGNDTIDAGEGDDSVSAGDGGDTVFGNAGGDTVDGGAGDDSIRGDSGEDGITAVRESFNWAELGLNNGETIPNNANGIDQDTGNITVNLDYTELGRFSDFEYRNTFAQNTDGIDTGGEAIGNDIGFLVGDGTSPAGDTTEVNLNFSANAAGFEDEVRNVQFRINDVDDLNWRDIVEVNAFDANGDPVHVVLTGGSNITLTDTDGVNGLDTAIANNTNTNNDPIDASNSLLIEVPGPVANINIVYGNLETGGQRVDITDIFFDAVPTAIANVETGDDSLLGGAGDDTIFGEAGEDTIDGGTDDDSVEGGAGDDLLVINDNFGNDTITGGEIGETTGDTLDGGALTEAVNVVYSGDEAGDAANAVTGDSAAFSQIEHINTGSGDDTIDGTLDTVGIDLNAGAGSDTILGGQAGDTLNAGAGDDTIDGQAGVDTITAGDGDDEIRLTDGFDNDSIIGGEGGETTGDTVSGATLTEDVVVTYDGDESGNFVGQTSGDNAAFDEIEGVTTGSGDDTVDASADSTGQIITTNAGTDSILGGAGGDTIDAGTNNDIVDGGAGADSIAGGGGSDNILGGTGDDTIDGGTGGDTIDGGEGADSINASNGFDLINVTGNFGNDTIVGGENGNDGDTLDGGTLTEDINVTFSGDEAGNFTGQTTGSDATFSEIEVINTGSGDDTVNASADSVGTTINTGAGTDTVLGGAGGDTLTTGTGDDTVDGGAGADSINAGDGDDELRLTDGFGNDTIIAGEGGETNGDTLAGGGLTEDVTVTFANDEDGTVTNNGGDSAGFEEIERVETGSGADTIDATASTGGVDVDSGEGADTITGGSGADTLAAAGGADTINGGAGDDSITAGDGDDVIQLAPGYDNDTIVGGEGGETNGDTLDGSTLAEDIVVTYDGDEQGNFVGQNTGDNADFAEIEAINTGAGDDTIDASADSAGINVQTNAGDDSVIGGAGDDQISTGANADTVDGGLGADTITAGDGDDLIQLTGNFGDDSITGGEGGQTNGDTLDGSTLTENVNVTFNGDEAGNFTGAATGSDATFSEIEAVNTGSGDDTVNASADTGGVTVNTGAGADTVLGGQGGDTLNTGTGQDTVNGGAGADSINAGDDEDSIQLTDGFGDDTIAGGEGGTDLDTLAGGALTEAVTVTFNNDGESGTVTNPGGDTATFSEIEAVETGSGADTIDASGSPVGVNVDSGAGADTVTGGTGDDIFAAGAGDDTIAAGAGADSITAGDGDDDIQLTDNFGDDTIVGGEGAENNGGDEIDASAVTEAVTVLYDGDEQGAITGANTGDSAAFSEIEEITTGSGDDTVNAAADTVGVTINTGAGADTVLGGQGGDTLNTGTGQDTVNGGAGADSINAGDDEDSIQLTDGFGDDTIAGGEGGTDDDTLAGGALTEAVTVTFNADDESGTVTNPGGDTATFSEIEAVETGSGDDTIDGSASTGGINVDSGAGADTMSGGAGDDTLAAGEGADTVNGGLGADSITGGGGDDELRIANQFGDDTIVGGETNETTGDTLNGGALTENVIVTFNNDDESGTITNPGGDSVQFSEIEAVATGVGDDTIDASASTGGVNVDSGAGEDSITGGTGGDTLSGGAGNDTFDSGAGDDLLDGGEDADTFILRDGFGSDTISGGEGDTSGGGLNEPDSNPANDLVSATGDLDVIDFSALTTNVDIDYSAPETGIATAGADSVAFSGIEKFVLTGNDDIVDGQAETEALNVEGGGGGDSLTGGAGNDRFVGGLGGDTLTGGEGDDILEGGDGDDSLFGGDGDDKVFGGEGDDFVISTPGEDTVFGGAGGDTISVGEETDLVFGGDGADSLDGGSNDDVIFGGAGADTIEGGVPALESGVLVGGGNDTIDAGLDNDVVNAGDGDDVVAGSGGSDTIDGGVGADTIQGDAGITLVRESFNWSEIPDPDDGGVIDDADILNAGTVQDTGGVSVTMSYNDDGAGLSIEYQNGATQNIAGLDGGAETVSDTSAGRLTGVGAGPNATTTFSFASNDPLVDDDVRNVQFRVNDIDEGTFRDTIQIRAFDAFGNPVEVELTGGSNLNLTDTDGVEGVDQAQAIDGTGNNTSADATNSLLVDIAGPVARIEVVYSNAETEFQAVEITDIFFDTQVTNTTGAGDSITGGDGDDVISGQAGDDTIDGGAGADSIEGDGDITGPATTTSITEDNFTETTNGYTVTAQNIVGGVLGAPSVNNVGVFNGTLGADGVVSDTDSGQNAQVAFDLASGQSETLIVDLDDPVSEAAFDFNFLFTQNFAEVGHYAVFLDGVLVSEADFTEGTPGTGSGSVGISGVGDFDQIVFTALPQTDGTDGSDYGVSNITFPVPGEVVASDPPGDDSILGGAGEDTILGQEGSDTIDGGIDADLINAGDDQDTIQLTNNFGNDTIVGGEGGTDGDTLDHSGVTNAPIDVQYTGDEAGTTTDGTSTATFSEIETQILTGLDDTLDATLDTVGVNVFAGAGDDTLLGGTGPDTIRGEAGDDTIDGGAGADSITGGDGDDELRLNDGFGDDTIVGGEGGETNGDTLAGGALTEDVTVTFNADGESGSVTNPGGDSATFSEIEAVETGSGDDTIDGSAATVGVTVSSGAGEDIITGGAGDDSIDAGDDDDTITFGQNDTVLGGAGADEFIVQPSTGGMGIIGDFDPSTNVDNTVIYDPANPPDQTDNDFVDLSSFFDNINELRDANTPNGDGDVVLDLGDGQTLTFVGVSDVTLLNFENTNVICFTRGAMIRTPHGDVAVEDLEIGSLVETMDSGAQPVRWIGRRIISAGMLDATPRLRPIRITKGALGASRDLMVSPQHRMLLTGDRAEMMFGVDQVLASAKDLVDGDTIHMGPAEDVEYFHILFDDHEIIFAEDTPTESFHPGEQALSTTTTRMQAEIFELFPELAEDCVNRPTARMVLKSHEAKAYAS